MNRYPAWWCDTITIYNRYENPSTKEITWHRHILHNCFIKNTGNKVRIGNAVLETNKIIVRIPKSDKYKGYSIWLNGDKDKYFTMHQDDIIVFGEVNDAINEYEKGYRSTDILAKYRALNKCLTIQKFNDDSGYARGIQHYYIEGE